MLAPNEHVGLEMKVPDMTFFTDVYAYVKKGRTTDPEDTICTVKKTFGNTAYSRDGRGRKESAGKTLHENVHFNGKTCRIDPA